MDYNIADVIKLDVTGYYKDGSREADVITGVYAATYSSTKALMVSNSGYSDVRGIETKIDSRFNGIINFGLSHKFTGRSMVRLDTADCMNQARKVLMFPKDLDKKVVPGEIIRELKVG